MKEMEGRKGKEETARYLSCPFCSTTTTTTVQLVLFAGLGPRDLQHWDLQQKAGAKRGHGLKYLGRVLFPWRWEMLEPEYSSLKALPPMNAWTIGLIVFARFQLSRVLDRKWTPRIT